MLTFLTIYHTGNTSLDTMISIHRLKRSIVTRILQIPFITSISEGFRLLYTNRRLERITLTQPRKSIT